MKTLPNISKSIVLMGVLIYVTAFNNGVAARDFSSEKDCGVVEAIIVDHSARLIEDKSFINWRITGLTRDCLFLVQRSVNDAPFETIEVKKGHGGGETLTVLYCHVDEEKLTGVVKYQVRKIEFDDSSVEALALRID